MKTRNKIPDQEKLKEEGYIYKQAQMRHGWETLTYRSDKGGNLEDIRKQCLWKQDRNRKKIGGKTQTSLK